MACLPPAASDARADELLLMPFACEAGGGRISLTPGQERGYRILGQREQRRFTACSAANPTMCRRWKVYRFDLDCDGTRVSWVEVVAAANEASRRAWLADGRLQLRMPPRWGLAPDDPCANESALGDLFGDRRKRRYCAQRLAQEPPAAVEMPSGYAPMLGLDAIFVDVPASVAGFPPEPPARWPRADRSTPIPRDEPPRSPPAGEATARRTPAERPPAAPPHSVSEEAHSGALPPAPAGGVPEGAPPALDVAPPASRAAKRATPPADKPPAERRPPEKAPAPDAKPAAKVALAPTRPARDVAPPAAAKAPPQDEAVWPGSFDLGALRTTTIGVVAIFAGLALGLVVAFTVARRQRPHRAAGLRRRTAEDLPRLGFDDGSVDPAGKPDSPLSRVPGAGAADAALAAWGDGMPRTRKEAIQALGIGARRGTAEPAAVKKIVDALRKKWHPDLARDDADRELHELRSKQINAAWDLLQRERAEA
jgi:hypothetical protein